VSVVGLYQPTYAVYAATKAGIEAITHVLAKELRGGTIADRKRHALIET
jgi:3-oxoacyl-[acyl-carrier protein] reductase